MTSPDDLLDPPLMRRLELLSIRSSRPMYGRHRGERKSPRKGGNVEFADFRPYYPGDDFRAIDWAAYARLEQLFVKLFVEEEDLHVYLLLDTSASMDFGEPNKFLFARRLAAALAYIALAGLDRVSLIGWSAGRPVIEPPRRGKPAIFKLLDSMASMTCGGPTSLSTTVDQLLARRLRPGVAIIISDFLDPEGAQRPIDRLCFHKFQPMAIQVLAPGELEPDLRGDLQLVDSESGREIDVSMNQRARRQYQLRLRELLDQIETSCKRRRVPYLRTRSDAPLEALTLRYLRQARMLAG